MGTVYALRQSTEEKFKIGLIRSGSANARRKALSTGNPNQLTLVAEIDTPYPDECERYLHLTLASKRINGEGTEWFDISPKELLRAFDRARQHMAEHEDDLAEIDRLKAIVPDDQLRAPTREELSWHQRLKELQEQEGRIKYERLLIENKLKIAIGSSAGLAGVATWKTVTSKRLDTDRLKEERKEIYEAFQKTVQLRRFDLK